MLFIIIILYIDLFLGSAFGAIFTASMGTLPRYFDTKRARANSMAFMGLMVGRIVMPPLWVLAVEAFAARGALIVFSGLFLQIVVCGALFFPVKNHPNSEERCQKEEIALLEHHAENKNAKSITIEAIDENIYQQKEVQKDIDGKSEPVAVKDQSTMTKQENKKSHHKNGSKAMTLELSLFKNPYYVTVLFGNCLGILMFTGIQYGLPLQLRHRQISFLDTAYVLSTMTVSDMICRLISGFVLDLEAVRRLNVVPLFSACCFLVAASLTMSIPFIWTLAGYIGYAIVMGIFIGQFFYMIPLVLVQFVGTDKLPNALAYGGLLSGLAQSALPLIMGKYAHVFDHSPYIPPSLLNRFFLNLK